MNKLLRKYKCIISFKFVCHVQTIACVKFEANCPDKIATRTIFSLYWKEEFNRTHFFYKYLTMKLVCYCHDLLVLFGFPTMSYVFSLLNSAKFKSMIPIRKPTSIVFKCRISYRTILQIKPKFWC